TRETYTARIRCASGETFRVAFGNDFEDLGRVIGNETQLACDGGVHGIQTSVLEPYGGQIYVVGRPGSSLELLVTGVKPPIDLVRETPGWTLSSRLRPHFRSA